MIVRNRVAAQRVATAIRAKGDSPAGIQLSSVTCQGIVVAVGAEEDSIGV